VLAGSGSSKALRLDSVLSRSFAELGTVRLVSRRTKSWLVALVLGQVLPVVWKQDRCWSPLPGDWVSKARRGFFFF